MRAHLVALLALSLAFAGCVEEDTPGVEPAPPADEPGAAPDVVDLDEVVPTVEPIEVPFAVDGESPRGVWVCAIFAVKGDCEIYHEHTGRFEHDIPHDGTVIALDLTITYTPATPETKGIAMFAMSGDDDQWEGLGVVEGQSGTTLSVQDLNVSTDTPLRVVAWNMADADAQGPVWLDPVPQPYRIEGTVTMLPF